MWNPIRLDLESFNHCNVYPRLLLGSPWALEPTYPSWLAFACSWGLFCLEDNDGAQAFWAQLFLSNCLLHALLCRLLHGLPRSSAPIPATGRLSGTLGSPPSLLLGLPSSSPHCPSSPGSTSLKHHPFHHPRPSPGVPQLPSCRKPPCCPPGGDPRLSAPPLS